ncbi:two component transcriptional regulator, LuxR family [Xylanimonas cellulosilytica DSM 15894]|uniref:Two component transcriptional regulator, LuxR family n=1 Tax=Xylanimonas cellulosilytica (strain DSM 15894 / JCM 12276 / CECT 5975 / KCTC 9989 / LMG 20990 / NBRC 107835 / XIL07) TaxID=446471 RepID=D1BXI8_XYLCX|nr:response regulator transcription factor [Xylanimonas cellulosilytica]ACZ29798.1 two component transcriptional regulator, LuxR family [Xylanimonas cellulosilytica DSM 15894]
MDTLAAVTTVALVDDDALVRAGLSLILGGDPELRIVGEAADGVAAIELVRRERPDVVLMDIRMPRLDGLAATQRLVAAGTRSRIIVLTTFDADAMVLEALQAGAAGFLLKDTPPERLVAAVHAAAAGEPTLSPTVTASLIASVAGSDGGRRVQAVQRLADLTEREREVAVAVGRGLSNTEIAASLYMGVATVKTHVSRVLAKLGVENRVQVAILVHDAGEV